jgi:hypothetical protein
MDTPCVKVFAETQPAAYKHYPTPAQVLAHCDADIRVWNNMDKNGWTPLRTAEGVHRTGTFRSSPETAAVFRKFITAAGLSIEIVTESAPLDLQPPLFVHASEQCNVAIGPKCLSSVLLTTLVVIIGCRETDLWISACLVCLPHARMASPQHARRISEADIVETDRSRSRNQTGRSVQNDRWGR